MASKCLNQVEGPIFFNASLKESLRTDKEGLAQISIRTTKVHLENEPEGKVLYLKASLSFIKN